MNLLREYVNQVLCENSSTAQLTINGVQFYVELAITERSRNEGLMFRESLSRDAGMLFVFPDSGPRSFWMKNTYIPLSIAYLNESGKILNIEHMTPFNLTGVKSVGHAKYALEMNRGWFWENGIQSGDTVSGIPAMCGRLLK